MVVVAFVSMLVGVVYAMLVGAAPERAALLGLLIGGSLSSLELLFVQSSAGAPLRRASLPVFVGVLSLLWLLLILAILEGVPRLLEWRDPRFDQNRSIAELRLLDTGFSFLVALCINVAMRVQSLAGPRVLANFLLGRYHRPVREQRVFMFLDLAGSTAMAERLGDERTQALIARFFFEIATPIAEHGGETHRYIGDEVVVTWPLQDAARDGRCLACVAAITRLTRATAQRYRGEFGETPRFRVGLHCGSVVASEVGDDKREIVYFGDTVNTAARVAALARTLERDWLVTGEVLQAMPLPAGVRVEAMGEHALRGRHRTIAIHALSSAD